MVLSFYVNVLLADYHNCFIFKIIIDHKHRCDLLSATTDTFKCHLKNLHTLPMLPVTPGDYQCLGFTFMFHIIHHTNVYNFVNLRELNVHCSHNTESTFVQSSSRMRVMNHNWSARKQRLHLQSVAEISRHSVLSGDRIRQCETSSGCRHKDTDQCL